MNSGADNQNVLKHVGERVFPPQRPQSPPR
jgi:hypothetical protein